MNALRKDGFEATKYEIATDQFGTQLDPPAHWAPEYPGIDELPATYAVRPLVVISIVPQVKKDPKYAAEVIDLSYESGLGLKAAIEAVCDKAHRGRTPASPWPTVVPRSLSAHVARRIAPGTPPSVGPGPPPSCRRRCGASPKTDHSPRLLPGLSACHVRGAPRLL